MWEWHFFLHVNQCICWRWYKISRILWDCERHYLRNTPLCHVSLLTWYREYLNILVLLSWKKTRRYRISWYMCKWCALGAREGKCGCCINVDMFPNFDSYNQFCPCVFPSRYVPVCLYVCVSICLSLWVVCLSVCISMWLFVCLYVCRYVCLSVCF